MATIATPIQLVLEVYPDPDLLRGRLRRDGEWLPFTGWTELGQTIVRLTEAADTTEHRSEHRSEHREETR